MFFLPVKQTLLGWHEDPVARPLTISKLPNTQQSNGNTTMGAPHL